MLDSMPFQWFQSISQGERRKVLLENAGETGCGNILGNKGRQFLKNTVVLLRIVKIRRRMV